MNQLQDKVAIVTGAARGIGEATAKRFIEEGAKALLRESYDVEVRIHSIDLTANDLEQQLDTVVDNLDVGLMIYNAGAMHGAELTGKYLYREQETA